MTQRNLYEVLGVAKTASESDIRKAYRKIARDNHPDRNPDDKQAEERFKEASFAKDVLLNQKKRKLYDEFGEQGIREGFDPDAYRQYQAYAGRGGRGGFGQVNLEDLFGAAGQKGGAQAWSGSFQDFIDPSVVETIFGRAQGQGRGRAKQDVMSQVNVSFVEAISGVEKEFLFQDARGGEGKTLKVRIPAGVEDGGRVRLRGQAPGGGDVVLEVHVGTHPHFSRQGSDLLLNLPLTVGEAYRGAKVPVPTPAGEVTLTVPAGVRSGAKLRLRGKGVKRGKQVGDLLVTIQVMVPEAKDEETEKLVSELDAKYEGSLREGIRL